MVCLGLLASGFFDSTKAVSQTADNKPSVSGQQTGLSRRQSVNKFQETVNKTGGGISLC
jgi:hypothetical protein